MIPVSANGHSSRINKYSKLGGAYASHTKFFWLKQEGLQSGATTLLSNLMW
jgi:hypothetical protein